MQFSTVEIRFNVTTLLYSTFANDLKRKYFFSKNVHSNRVCSFNINLSFSYSTASKARWVQAVKDAVSLFE